MRYGRFIGDASLNLLASCVPLVLLQLLILPCVASYLSEGEYGLAVTLIALLSLCPGTIGNVLSNLRLMDNSANCPGTTPQNYSLLLLLLTVLGSFATMAATLYFTGEFDASVVFMGALAVLTALREYYIVAYRIVLDYRRILYNNILLSIGYGVGFGLFVLVGYWELIYLCGLAFSLAFIVATTSIWREPPSVDGNLKPLIKDSSVLLSASVLGRTTSYADRMVIFPLLGGVETSIYYVATLFGKVVSFGVSPLNSVVLSHLAKLGHRPKRAFWACLGVGASISVFGYILTMLLARPLLAVLYPQFVDAAMPYVGVATATAYFGAMVTIVDPYVLRFFPLKWQILENAGFGMLYFTLALMLLARYGLIGFCVGALVAAVLKLSFLIILYCKGNERVI